jgi:hypothetical protein
MAGTATEPDVPGRAHFDREHFAGLTVRSIARETLSCVGDTSYCMPIRVGLLCTRIRHKDKHAMDACCSSY